MQEKSNLCSVQGSDFNNSATYQLNHCLKKILPDEIADRPIRWQRIINPISLGWPVDDFC
jgi:hypothetical protein